MAVKKSIAIIGEGETEWWYFETTWYASWIWTDCSDCPQKWQLISD